MPSESIAHDPRVVASWNVAPSRASKSLLVVHVTKKMRDGEVLEHASSNKLLDPFAVEVDRLHRRTWHEHEFVPFGTKIANMPLGGWGDSKKRGSCMMCLEYLAVMVKIVMRSIGTLRNALPILDRINSRARVRFSRGLRVI